MGNDTEVSAGALCRLLGITRQSLFSLVKAGIAVYGQKRGTYRLETVTAFAPTYANKQPDVAVKMRRKRGHVWDRHRRCSRRDREPMDDEDARVFRNRILGIRRTDAEPFAA